MNGGNVACEIELFAVPESFCGQSTIRSKTRASNERDFTDRKFMNTEPLCSGASLLRIPLGWDGESIGPEVSLPEDRAGFADGAANHSWGNQVSDPLPSVFLEVPPLRRGEFCRPR
jgi:hypothetical protein